MPDPMLTAAMAMQGGQLLYDATLGRRDRKKEREKMRELEAFNSLLAAASGATPQLRQLPGAPKQDLLGQLGSLGMQGFQIQQQSQQQEWLRDLRERQLTEQTRSAQATEGIRQQGVEARSDYYKLRETQAATQKQAAADKKARDTGMTVMQARKYLTGINLTPEQKAENEEYMAAGASPPWGEFTDDPRMRAMAERTLDLHAANVEYQPPPSPGDRDPLGALGNQGWEQGLQDRESDKWERLMQLINPTIYGQPGLY